MAINSESKEKIKTRLARAIGHLNAVHRMVDEEKYCIDVLNQLKAVQAALDKAAAVILKQHLETCVVEAIRGQDEKRAIDELIQVFRQAPSLYSDDVQTSPESDELKAAAKDTNNKEHKSGCCH